MSKRQKGERKASWRGDGLRCRKVSELLGEAFMRRERVDGPRTSGTERGVGLEETQREFRVQVDVVGRGKKHMHALQTNKYGHGMDVID